MRNTLALALKQTLLTRRLSRVLPAKLRRALKLASSLEVSSQPSQAGRPCMARVCTLASRGLTLAMVPLREGLTLLEQGLKRQYFGFDTRLFDYKSLPVIVRQLKSPLSALIRHHCLKPSLSLPWCRGQGYSVTLGAWGARTSAKLAYWAQPTTAGQRWASTFATSFGHLNSRRVGLRRWEAATLASSAAWLALAPAALVALSCWQGRAVSSVFLPYPVSVVDRRHVYLTTDAALPLVPGFSLSLWDANFPAPAAAGAYNVIEEPDSERPRLARSPQTVFYAEDLPHLWLPAFPRLVAARALRLCPAKKLSRVIAPSWVFGWRLALTLIAL